MSKVITLRLKKELNIIKRLSEMEKEDRSTAARKLMNYGWIYIEIIH